MTVIPPLRSREIKLLTFLVFAGRSGVNAAGRQDDFDVARQEVPVRRHRSFHAYHVVDGNAAERVTLSGYVGLPRDYDMDRAAAFEDGHGRAGFCRHKSFSGLGTLEGQR
jgi:hypothetical protein